MQKLDIEFSRKKGNFWTGSRNPLKSWSTTRLNTEVSAVSHKNINLKMNLGSSKM